ncbi:hypothetical protein PK28_06550 [Hymenobacter sp. DG25B]|uniref:hypothetical protein n=1 Tax=Hymenobacter sp. DG25B TaxID=1385664 RepID=UPI000541146F|nr:hypothetical protein [Hymenobacter sp. DG25B]AIZ63432.1 hypothetical protein PK28_06550 [Hymenobacter sp. DG25B]
MLAVIIAIGLVLFIIFLINLTINPNVVEKINNDINNFYFPVIIGILSLFVSANYFGRKAGVKINKDTNAQSSGGFVAALQVLIISALTVSLAEVIQISWIEGFDVFIAFYFLLRIAVAMFLLGFPFALLLGYGFEYLLIKKLKKP